MSKILIALGGNALGDNPMEQLQLVADTAKSVVDLIEKGHTIILAHGNGPQVGMINLAFESAANVDSSLPNMPFAECGAMSQGYIGYHLQNAIHNELFKRGIDKQAAAVVTQTLVQEEDSAFSNPTKPIGSFYTKQEAERLTIEKSYTMVEDAGRGYRRVVASPKPVDIIESGIIKSIVEGGHVAIAVGGGGIPVVNRNGKLIGVPAVIDKDSASDLLARLLDCDIFFMLTAVECAAINYGKENQQDLRNITVSKAEEYIKEGHFAKGSMLPKIEAAISFAKSKKGRTAIIASLEHAKEAINGSTGTRISL